MLLITAAQASAQDRSASTFFGLGYAANAPDLMAGGAAYVVVPALGGIGLYVDAKFDTSSPRDHAGFEPGLSARQVDDEIGDEFQADESSWRSVNVAAVRPLTPSFMVYAGAGYARETVYRQYHDTSFTRGQGGLYWVESTEEEESGINVLLGLFLRMTRHINAQFGVENAPRGVTVGLSVVLP